MITNNFRTWYRWSMKTAGVTSEIYSTPSTMKDVAGQNTTSMRNGYPQDYGIATHDNGIYATSYHWSFGQFLWVGSDDTQASENDYKITPITGITDVSRNLTVSPNTDGTQDFAFTRTFINNNENEIVVKEVALVKFLRRTDTGSSSYLYVMAREVLPQDKWITVQSGQSFTVSMVIKM